MRLIFVRHGESEANILREFSNRGLKHGLTDLGREQAHTLAAHLQSTAIGSLYTSPLLRAIQTAEMLSDVLQIPYVQTDALREYDCGFLEGRSDEAGWELYEIVLHEWLVNRHWSRRILGGESFLDMQARFVPFVNSLVATQDEKTGAILLVGHGGLYRCMLPLVLTNIDFDFTLQHHLGNTEAVVAEVDEAGLRCRTWGPLKLD